MTFSICVRERFTDDDGEDQLRFGVAVTTRLPGVGTLCPFVSEHGAVATQGLVNVDLGRKGIEYVDDGIAVEDALRVLLNADDDAERRQLHGVDATGTFAFSGPESRGWYGHTVGENYTVAGNLLTGEAVVDATAAAYEQTREGAIERPLAERLLVALAAGHAEGGDRRDDLEVQSAAIRVETTATREVTPFYDDLRVDATTSPIADLRETYELARKGYESALERYRDADQVDDVDRS